MRWTALIGLLVAVYLVLQLGPREEVDLTISFSAADLGEDLDAYLLRQEARVPGIRPNLQKSIHWAGARGARTEYAVVYLHGFSASKEELRPVPDMVAAELGANLYFTRFTGHGRDEAAMAQATVNDWLNDAAEAVAIGRRLGEKVVVISTSTGGTIFTILAMDPEQMRNVAGAVMVSPNFGLMAGGARLLTLPLARHFVPLVIGKERRWQAQNPLQEAMWTTSYPSVALLPMAAAVSFARDLPVGIITVPAQFIYAQGDQVVSAEATAEMAARWGARADVEVMPEDRLGDASRHVLGGNIVSPETTDDLARMILDWVGTL